MPDVLHQFVIEARCETVWHYFATPEGIAKWWTASGNGIAGLGAVWQYYFTPEYDWRARVTKLEKHREIEFTMIEAMEDWIGTRVGVELREDNGKTNIDFYHRGWAEESDHFRISSFCWATYLRLLKRHIEHGEFTPYGERDFV